MPRPADNNTADFGEDKVPVVQPRPIAILLIGNGLVAFFALEAWESWLLSCRQAAKERLLRLVKACQHIVQHVAVDGSILRQLASDVLSLGFLLKTGRTLSRSATPPRDTVL